MDKSKVARFLAHPVGEIASARAISLYNGQIAVNIYNSLKC